MCQADYRRFLALLYACNSVEPIHVSNYEQGFRSKTLSSVLKTRREMTLVDIGAYNLMPNHHHFLLREARDGGITSFMRKLGTAYTMYFNIKYERAGSLYQGAFKAKHVRSDHYFGRVLNYINGNHAALYEPKWKEGIIKNERGLKKMLAAYPYSSATDYYGVARPESIILNREAVMDTMEKVPSLEKIIEEAQTFARQYEKDLVPASKWQGKKMAR